MTSGKRIKRRLVSAIENERADDARSWTQRFLVISRWRELHPLSIERRCTWRTRNRASKTSLETSQVQQQMMGATLASRPTKTYHLSEVRLRGFLSILDAWHREHNEFVLRMSTVAVKSHPKCLRGSDLTVPNFSRSVPIVLVGGSRCPT